MTPVLRRFLHATLLAAASLYGSTSYALDTVTLQLKWSHTFEFAGYYAAIEQGYYRDAGLSVNIKEAQTGIDSVTEIVEGKAQYATGSSSLILEHKAGKPVVLLAVIFQHSPYQLIARQTQSVHDLADKPIMLEPQAKELLAYLKSEGLAPEKLTLLEHTYDPQDLINGTINVMSASSIFQPYYLERANFNYQTYSPRAVGIDFYGDNLFTSERELKEHPERVKAFRAASLRGWQYAMEHPEEITSLILKQYSQRHPRQYFLFQARQMMSLMHPELVEIGDMSKGRWRHIADTYADINLLPKDYPLEGFLYNTPRTFNRNILYAGMATALLFIFITGGFSYYILRIKRKAAHSVNSEKSVETQKHSRNKVLELLASNSPLTNILEDIISNIEQENPDMRCSISLLDRSGTHLLNGAAPNLPDAFNHALNGIEIGIGVASCGTAAFTGQRVIVEDIQTHPYWSNFTDISRKAQLTASWSEPIHSASGKVLGTFDIYLKNNRKPEDNDLQLMVNTANMTAIALDRNHSDLALKENEKLMSDILENVSAYIYMKDTQGRYLYANRPMREMFNAPIEEILGFDDSKFYDASTAANIKHSDQQILQQNDAQRSEETHPNPLTGHTSVYLTTKLPLRHQDGNIYALCGIATDITKEKEIEEHIRHMAQYDALTNMPNRALFADRLQQVFANAKRGNEHFGLMYIDLDKFKPINDTFGHEAGDFVLKEAAQRMQSCVRQSDTVARLGGDEFVVLLSSLNADQDAFEVGEKIRHALNLPFEMGSITMKISSSIGVAIYPEHGDDEKSLVKNADTAMYFAKENGRNNVTIYHAGLEKTK
jgi:diguanylate cyclase (GGDEF)-like protein/PAS domain S-box-containing protein